MNTSVKTPKVSVCVITYNQEKYIRQCLQSIVDQETDFDFEVIVGEDCSTDGTRAIVQEFERRYPGIVKPIYQERNIGGGVHNFLSVHKAALGKYVSQIDGDDIAFPSKLQKQADFLDENPQFSVVWHRVNYFDDFGHSFDGKFFDYSMFPGGVVTFSSALRIGSVAVSSSTVYRRCARLTVNPKFPTLDLFYSWEYLSSGLGMILDDVLGAYRVNSIGAVSKKSISLMRLLNAHHANIFYERNPENKKDIFIFAFTNMIIDIKNRRKTFINFFVLAVKTISFVSPCALYFHMVGVKKIRTPRLTTVSNN